MLFFKLDKNIVSQRFRALRLSHHLSGGCLAELLQFKSQGTIGNIEAGKTLPLFESATSIANLFAVSLDWITGRSDTIYVDTIVGKLEKHLLKEAKTINDVNLRYFRHEMYFMLSPSFQYNDENFRLQYSLEVRANIVFIMQVLYHISYRMYELHQTPMEEMNGSTINKILIPALKKEKNGKAFLELEHMCKDTFHDYMSQTIDTQKPVFDVAKILKEI